RFAMAWFRSPPGPGHCHHQMQVGFTAVNANGPTQMFWFGRSPTERPELLATKVRSNALIAVAAILTLPLALLSATSTFGTVVVSRHGSTPVPWPCTHAAS